METHKMSESILSQYTRKYGAYASCSCIICYFRSTGAWPEAPTESDVTDTVEMAAVDGFQTVGSTDINFSGNDAFFTEATSEYQRALDTAIAHLKKFYASP